jgi:hypothetical protein
MPLKSALRGGRDSRHPIPIKDVPPELSAIERERIVPIKIAAELKGCSVDTLEEHYPQHIIQIAPKLRGMRIKHALQLPD